jgi:molybdate transport system regulatory protein
MRYPVPPPATAVPVARRAVTRYPAAMDRTTPLRLKAMLFCDGERALGPGRADLLEAIDREGSISGAGRALGMSYRYTWLLVDSMNRCFREPLTEAAAGGRKGGGARLTGAGREVLAAYRELEARVARAARGPALEVLTARMRETPLSPGVADG